MSENWLPHSIHCLITTVKIAIWRYTPFSNKLMWNIWRPPIPINIIIFPTAEWLSNCSYPGTSPSLWLPSPPRLPSPIACAGLEAREALAAPSELPGPGSTVRWLSKCIRKGMGYIMVYPRNWTMFTGMTQKLNDVHGNDDNAYIYNIYIVLIYNK